MATNRKPSPKPPTRRKSATGRPRREKAETAPPRPSAPRRISRLSRILSKAGLGLRKSLGQNFLVNQGALEKIAASVGAGPESVVLEIGPGLGNLTELLARQAGVVFAVELDERFRPLHRENLGAIRNIQFIYSDFMQLDLPALFAPCGDRDIRVVGNIPYHLTSPILLKLIATRVPLAAVCLLMQREVGHRLTARPGSRNYGVLSIKAAVRYDVTLDFTIAPGSFLPPPKVHSSLVRFVPRSGGALVADTGEREAFFRFIDAAFAQRRKMLGKSLEAGTQGRIARADIDAASAALGLDATVRPESISPQQFLQLFRALGAPDLPAIRKAIGD